jgi:hypothetical protein
MKATPSAMKRDLIRGVASLEIGNLVDTISYLSESEIWPD